MQHSFSLLVENAPGVLSRVAGLIARRGYNIESLTVSATQSPRYSRMTIVMAGDDAVLEQVGKQLNKLVEVLRVWDITDRALSRELALIRVAAPQALRRELLALAQAYRATPVDFSREAIVLEVTGSAGKVNAFLEILKDYEVQEIVRTGTVALERGRLEKMLIEKED